MRWGCKEAVGEPEEATYLRREPSAGAPARLKELPWRSRSLVLGRAAHLPLRRLQRRGNARLLVLVLHDGPVEHIVPLEACTHECTMST